jgi:hypothetical protein
MINNILYNLDCIVWVAAETEKWPKNNAFFLFSRKQPWRASVYVAFRG